MAYEKDLEYLRGELKNSEDKLREAEINGYVTDAEMWESDAENLRHQIHIHERASKADEYEAKADAFDEVIEASENIDNHIDFTEAIDEIVIRYKGAHL